MKICPKCGSKNVDWIIPQNWSMWECKDCDYTGPIIEGDEELANELQANYQKKTEHSEEDVEIEEELSDEEIDKRLDSLNI